jgi:hypothetical protein
MAAASGVSLLRRGSKVGQGAVVAPAAVWQAAGSSVRSKQERQRFTDLNLVRCAAKGNSALEFFP